MTRVAIIGAGSIGQALAHVLHGRASTHLSLYDKDATKITRAALPLPEVVKEADIVFACVPSWAMREVVSELRLHLGSRTIVVSLAKGIDPKGKKTMDGLLAELLPSHRTALLGGPMLAAELMQDLPGVGYLATEDARTAKAVDDLFSGTSLILEHTTDMRGAALSGVLKNIYALGIGIASGLGWENNQKGALVTRSLSEMAALIELLGGRKETAYSLAGVGDLIATGFSAYSRNSTFGEELVRSGVCAIQSEGCASLPFVAKMLAGQSSAFAVFDALLRVIVHGENAESIFTKLFTRA